MLKVTAPREFTLILKIAQGKKPAYYRLRQLAPHPGVATRAWRLELVSGKFYDVAVNARGFWSCTCGDFIFRRQNAPEGCKHLEALKLFHLLEPIHAETRR